MTRDTDMGQMTKAKNALKELVVRAAHESILLRMRLEAAWSRLSARPSRIRVIATACWHFPVYSQAFVYREVCELANQNIDLRFVYSELDCRSNLSSELRKLWSLKRRLILSDATSSADLKHYRRRMPERVDALVRLIAEASGLAPEEVIANQHFRHAFSFTRMADCWRAAYIHSYFFYERTFFALVASYILGIPRGVSCYADHMLQDYPLKLIPLQLAQCDVIVATSARIKQELESIAGGTLPNLLVKPNAIDTRQYAPESRTSRQAADPWQLVCVSRIHPKKGLVYLIEAVAELRRRGCAIEAHILGEPDSHDPESREYDRQVRQRIELLGAGPHIRLEGRKNAGEVRRFLAEADIFVAPSIELPNGDKDGIPTALLEAMAAGCAVVSTDAGSIPEVIENGVDGLIVEQRDSEALADAIAQLIHEEGLRARLARAATARVLLEFDVTRCEAEFHDRVRAAVEAARRPAQREMAPA
jgi:colanic acid/amylovoran biosynthesis glycosyltransferase